MSDEDDDANFGATDEEKFRTPKSRGGRTGSGRSGKSKSNGNGNLRPWVKGQSGNPSGRHNTTLEIMRQCREFMPRVIEEMQRIICDPKAMDRDKIQAAHFFDDRACGKPPVLQMDARAVEGHEIEPEEHAGLSALLMRARAAKGIQ